MMLDRIYNCDYKEGFKEIPDGMVSLCLTDCPYWFSKSPGRPYSERTQCNTKSAFSNSELFSCDGDMMKTMADFDDKCINEFLTLLEPKMKIMNAYMFCSEAQVPYYCMWAEKHGYMFSILVWEKPLSIINKNRFSQNIEYIVRVYDYGTALNRLEQNEFYNRVKKIKPVNGEDKIHLCQKPVALMEEFILLSTEENDLVLDPFAGSGTTAVACHRTNRQFLCFEVNEEYYKKAIKRLQAEQAQLTLDF